MLQWIQLPSNNCQSIAQAIEDGKARAISDGSLRPIEKTGTSGLFLTARKCTKTKFKGCNWIPGIPKEQNSCRSELAGIDGVLSVIKVIVQHYQIEDGSIKIACNGEAAIDGVKDDYFLKINQSCFDMIQDIKS